MTTQSEQEQSPPAEPRPKNELVRAALAGDEIARQHLDRHGDEITKLMAKA